jgi:hypothetical protein
MSRRLFAEENCLSSPGKYDHKKAWDLVSARVNPTNVIFPVSMLGVVELGR